MTATEVPAILRSKLSLMLEKGYTGQKYLKEQHITKCLKQEGSDKIWRRLIAKGIVIRKTQKDPIVVSIRHDFVVVVRQATQTGTIDLDT